MKIKLDFEVPEFEGTLEVPFPDHKEFTAVIEKGSSEVVLLQYSTYCDPILLATLIIPAGGFQVGSILTLDVEIHGYSNIVPNDSFEIGLPPKPKSTRHSVDGNDTRRILRESIPGFDNMLVKNPETGATQSIHGAIVYLNDSAGWSREAIADWLETLDYDLTIRDREEVKRINDAEKAALVEEHKALMQQVDWQAIKEAWGNANVQMTVNTDALKKAAAEAGKKLAELHDEILAKQTSLYSNLAKVKVIDGVSGFQIGHIWFDETAWKIEDVTGDETTVIAVKNKKNGKKLLVTDHGADKQVTLEPMEELKKIELDITFKEPNEQLLALLTGGMKTEEQLKEELGLNKEGEKK